MTLLEPSETIPRRNPVWTRDELILALDLYMRHAPSFPGDQHPDVVELSGVLNRLAELSTMAGDRKFRNPNGVAMKLQNFRRFDPSQNGKGLPGGGKGEEAIWNTFHGDPVRLQSAAAAIKVTIDTLPQVFELNTPDEEEAEEGAVLTRLHQFRERNRDLVERRKAKALKEHGTLACEACGFDFEASYGTRGAGFIECHHTKPLSALIPGERTRLEDLALLCANCHRMIHVRRPWMTLEGLRSVIQGPGTITGPEALA